ncbi:carboxymuconolactone decarboxylase family protein [Cronobacter sakazakii]|uniref:carboxymuconolactone decarboxylase family protein n=1 Tax=Cronobacter sakazakii TaxID=28141 RepID=UPI000BE7E1C0|nr:carboxymuconolactone decarboxylase family protein [Cronobacter sakazakii]ELY3737994.1 carboxymuconolactone decarboxylase family protein [Cronobacter sakazakii]ELY7492140.1 carboxymuconolactone decarboxylase family protein [Cronobacter sakazakii]ELY7495668.1 carboxymuconolactone decarboxylase family protein [Cronobacter sakazakii]MBK4112229.1 carboxymuconolactone decarboxylase family protein [Cronobacter sakazakii]MDT3616840.1 carboxymuconolactone decarboxylase family protein [Cronobacter sa
MSRLQTIATETATGKTALLFDTLKSAMGKVPNAYATIGSNAPDILSQALQHNMTLKKGALSARELEAINLVVSETTGCDYCLAAHTLMAKKAGYSADDTRALRAGRFAQDAHIDALLRFVKTVITTRGTLPESDVTALRAAGFDDRQVIEILSAISAILFTNMVNRVNDTVVDFPKAE